ncbi:SCP-like extracellular [Streptomyces sp. WAC 01529]|uniref:CAP domain-containing protein n=1 Tax=Streptomyces sp. WAC 01529 TaxID=2203205 RepID=UPI000F6CE0CC|nr:CAP domain-containing protein [Streptomyces sp. WAC 01529]AZM55777.1 SCP-like extracellular [Streptomyces sp. WAC 01529]
MGRHRRSGAGRAAVTPENHPVPVSHRRKARPSAPVRTGLLGVSAAVAMGAVAVASGVLPGSDGYRLESGGEPGKAHSASAPVEVDAQGGSDGDAGRAEPSPSRGAERSEAAPKPSPSTAAPEPSKKPSQKPSPSAPKPETDEESTPPPSRTPEEKPKAPPASPQTPSGESAAEAAVLTLVNEERAKVGCRPVTADSKLAELAGRFSADMAERDFFAHTDPDGATPWDRAEKAGIANLGGENIARGQADAQSVMAAWMSSPGHRANILNCDYKTLGVGAHFAPGGPWWTQDFGF